MPSPSKSTTYRQRKAAGELGPVGPPRVLAGSNIVKVVLDDDSLAIANRDGPRTMSATVRAALAALVEIEIWRSGHRP